MKFIIKFIKLFIFIAIIFFAIIITFSFSNVSKISIIGTSMLPSIHEGDSLFRLKSHKFKRGDVVIFTNNKKEKKYIKRVVGVPFDILTFDSFGNLLSINGKNIPYLYISDINIASFGLVQNKHNKDVSFLIKPYLSKIDKTIFPIYFFDKENLKTYSPEVKDYVNSFLDYSFLVENEFTISIPEKHYFMLSDNRFVGVDSRHFGFVHKNEISSIALK